MHANPTLRLGTLALAVNLTLTFPLAAPASGAAPVKSHAAPYAVFGSIERLDPALDQLLAPDAQMESLAEGFNWSEGPAWMSREQQVVFSDVPENIAYRWSERDGLAVFLQPSGFTGEKFAGREPGSNGLAVDAHGRLVLCQHGDRRLAQLSPDGKTFVTVADRFEGKRFNSPNDLCFDRRGNIYFTDPPYGVDNPPAREIDFQGVYRVAAADGSVTLVTRELERPNGIALSPDERTLYVANSHGPRPIIMAFDLREDGTPADRPGRVFFDSTPLRGEQRPGSMDGMKVDARGNLWATGPGGVLIIDPQGRHLGSLLTNRPTGNCTFGGDDGTTLYITADNVLCRIKTKVKGRGF